jgi:hypothetical protein
MCLSVQGDHAATYPDVANEWRYFQHERIRRNGLWPLAPIDLAENSRDQPGGHAQRGDAQFPHAVLSALRLHDTQCAAELDTVPVAQYCRKRSQNPVRSQLSQWHYCAHRQPITDHCGFNVLRCLREAMRR